MCKQLPLPFYSLGGRPASGCQEEENNVSYSLKMAGRRKTGSPSLTNAFKFIAKREQFLITASPSCLKQKYKKGTVGKSSVMQIMRNLP